MGTHHKEVKPTAAKKRSQQLRGKVPDRASMPPKKRGRPPNSALQGQIEKKRGRPKGSKNKKKSGNVVSEAVGRALITEQTQDGGARNRGRDESDNEAAGMRPAKRIALARILAQGKERQRPGSCNDGEPPAKKRANPAQPMNDNAATKKRGRTKGLLNKKTIRRRRRLEHYDLWYEGRYGKPRPGENAESRMEEASESAESSDEGESEEDLDSEDMREEILLKLQDKRLRATIQSWMDDVEQYADDVSEYEDEKLMPQYFNNEGVQSESARWRYEHDNEGIE